MMSATATPQLSGRHVWAANELLASPYWGWRLSEDHIAELHAAVTHAQSLEELTYTASGKPENLTPDRFPLPTLGTQIAKLTEELEHGTGAVLIRGLPVERYGDSRALGVMLLGMFSHMGQWVNMSRVALSGEHVGHGEPFGKVAAATDQMSPEQKMSSHGFAWHTDRCDLAVVLCVRRAKSGGASKVRSPRRRVIARIMTRGRC